MPTDFVIKGMTEQQRTDFFDVAVRSSSQSLLESENRYLMADVSFGVAVQQAEKQAPDGMKASQFQELAKNTIQQAAQTRLHAYLDYERNRVGHEALMLAKSALTSE